MTKAAYCAALAVVLSLSNLAFGSPGSGGSCSACHYHMNYVAGATTLTNYDTTAAPDPARGTLKVIRMQPGETRALQFEVGGWAPDPNGTNMRDLYATAFRGFSTPGLNGSILRFYGDPAWTRNGDYYYNPVSSYDGTTQSFSFNITVRTVTPLGYYPLSFLTGIYQNPFFGQVGIHGQEEFYLQVVPEPATVTLLAMAIGGLALKRRRCRGHSEVHP